MPYRNSTSTTPTRRRFSLALALAAATFGSGCGLLTAVAPPPTPTNPPVPPRTPTPVPTATPTSAPATHGTSAAEPSQRGEAASDAGGDTVGSEDAQLVVRQLFDAIENERWDQVRSMTTGQARDQADLLIGRLQDAERQQNVRVNLVVTKLVVNSPRIQSPWMRVGTDFGVDARVPLGPITITAESIQGRADFFVRRVDGRPIIERIEGDLR